MKTRILVAARVFPPKLGGIERYMFELHRRLRADFTVTVITPSYPGDVEFDRAAGLEIKRIPNLGDRFKISYIPVWIACFVMALIIRPSFVVFDQLDSALVGPLVRALGVRYFVFVYNAELFEPFAPRARRWALLRAAGIIAVSDHSAQRLAEFAPVDPSRVAVVYPGVDLDWLRAGDSNRARTTFGLGRRPLVLTVGRLSGREQYKGQDVLIAAIPQVLARVRDCHLVLVGDGDDRARLERLAVELGVERHVTFAGHVNQEVLADLYAAADVFALPAGRNTAGMTEGFGIVLLEAAATGTPVVFSPTGGAAEAVQAGITGISVDPTDADAIAEALTRLLIDPNYAQQIGAAGRKWVTGQFNWDRAATRYRTVLAQMSAA